MKTPVAIQFLNCLCQVGYEDGGYAMLHYECKLKYHVHEGLRECGWTEGEEEGKNMQSINRERKDQVDKSESNKENKLTKETKMPFFFSH